MSFDIIILLLCSSSFLMASLGFSMNSIMSSEKSDSFINEFYKVTGHKINIQKSVAFLYINNKTLEREIKEIMHLP